MNAEFKRCKACFCGLLLAVLPSLMLTAETVSTKNAVLEWKNHVMELRGVGDNPGRVVFRPFFTNGTKIEDVNVTEITLGRKAILLHGKDCSLTFALSSYGAVVRVSAPKNAGFTVETATSVMVVPDNIAEDLIVEPGEKALKIPSGVPMFMGLQGQGNWTLSCIPYLSRSDVTVSADLKTWGFRPQPLEEYTFVIQSGEAVWKKVEEKLDKKDRKVIDWKPPFPARYRAAFPVAKDFFDVEIPLHQIWNVGDENPKNNTLINQSQRVTIVDKKAQTGWSSGYYGTFPYPAYRKAGTGQLLMVYPRHRKKTFAYDPNRPIYIYTYDNGACPKRSDTPASFMEEPVRANFPAYRTSTIGIGPATCALTQTIEKIYSRGEVRTKRAEIRDHVARIQIFVESIRAKIGIYLDWAAKMKKACLAAAEKDSAAAPALKKLAGYLDCPEKCYQEELPRMQTPEKVWELGEQLLKDLDNKALDDEALETRCKEYGRAVRTIGGGQDNCVAECRHAVKMIRQQALLECLRNENPAVRKFCAGLYEAAAGPLRDAFVHEGK